LINKSLYAILFFGEERNRMAKRGRKRKYRLKNEACPNPRCSLYGKTGKANIVSNGTYPTKDGAAARRFLCKQCGESFCNRVGTIFYDLRSPEERVLMALKLLVKGMPLRGVAEVLEVKLDTVRHWLQVAAEQSEKIDALLIKELKVSQIELDALWSFVKKNSLRQRALLWRAKFGSALPLPRNTV
jgi:transposase-like protein